MFSRSLITNLVSDFMNPRWLIQYVQTRYFHSETREHDASVRGTSTPASTFFIMES